MSTIRTTLQEAAEAAPVPPIDEIAFRHRVRAHRRRRRGLAAAALAAAVVVPLVATPVVRHLVADRPARDVPPAGGPAEAGLGPVAFALGGRLHVLDPADPGESRDRGVAVEEPIVVRPDSVLAVGRDSELLVVPLRDGAARPLPGAGPAQWLDGTPDGGVLWVDLDGGVHLRPAAGKTLDVAEPGAAGDRVYDLDGTRWVSGEGSRLTVHTERPGGASTVTVDSPRPVLDADLAGERLAVRTDRGTYVADAATGRLLTGPLGGRVGALSADGRWWVAGGEEEALRVWDTTTGTARAFANIGDVDPVLAVTWQDGHALVVTDSTAGGTTVRTLYACRVASLRCDYLFEDETGSLTLPRG